MARRIKNIGNHKFSGIINYTDDQAVYKDDTLVFQAVIKTNSIAAEAFSGCYNLSDVTVINNDGTLDITSMAFNECHNLTRFNIQDGISIGTVGSFAFYDNFALDITDVLNNGCTAIEHCAFSGTTLPDNLLLHDIRKLGQDAFEYTKNKANVKLYNIKYIGECAFSGSELASIEVDKCTAYIPAYMCYRCENLTTVILHDGIEVIDSSAFEGCTNLKDIWLPRSINSIHWSAFTNIHNGLTIHCYKDTYVDTWAKNIKHGYGLNIKYL